MNEYKVGIVVPACGLSDNQLADLGSRLRFIRNYLGAEGRLTVVAPALDLAKPEQLPPQVAGVLAYRAQFQVETPRAFKPAVDGSVAAYLLDVLRGCDEVWCCTGPRQGATSKARSAELYRRAQALPMQEATRFKPVPAWVMTAAAKDAAKKTKAKADKELRWNDVF